MKISGLLSNTSFMMLVALIVAFISGGFPSSFPLSSGFISMSCLMIMMMISLSAIELRGVKIAPYKTDIAVAFLLTFVVSTGTTIAMAYLFTGDFRNGWILEASVPSAVSVISFTYLWGGNTESSAVSSVMIYLSSLAITPIITLIFLGEAVSELTLLYYVGVLIIIPLLLSPLIKRMITSAEVRSMLINVAFFVLIVTVAGTNRDVFFTAGIVIVGLIILATIRTFGLGLLFYRHSLRKGWGQERIVPGSLFITYKNTGMAASLALVLIGPEAAVPSAVCIVVEVIWLIFAGKYLYPKKIVLDSPQDYSLNHGKPT